jgi:SNF2 family DNA or RNA helicase
MGAGRIMERALRATITTDGRHILADIDYARGAGRDRAREIPGATPVYKDEKFQYWRYPLTMDTCHTFRRVFGEELIVLKPLSAWAHYQISANNEMDKIRSGNVSLVFSRIPREAPKLHAAIMSRSYQSEGVGWMSMAGQCILGDEPGLGKTLQTLAALVETDCKVILVTCPRTATRAVWEAETQRWAPGIATFVAQGTRSEREEVIGQFSDHPVTIEGTRKMLIVNTEMVRAKRVEECTLKDAEDRISCLGGEVSFEKHKHLYKPIPDWPSLHQIKWDAVVMDESHRALASTANTSSKRITQVRFGAMNIRKNVKPHGIAFALSGTPSRSNLTKTWGTLNWCRPDVWTSYWKFAGTHFGVTEGKYGMVVAGGDKVPKPLDDERFKEAIRPYFLQRNKKTAAPDLPDITYTGAPPPDNPDGLRGIWLPMEGQQLKAYQAMERMAMAHIKGGTLTATGVLAEITRLRQFAVSTGKLESVEKYALINGKGYVYNDTEFEPVMPSNKLDWVIQFLLEREGYDGKVVIASNFTQVIELLAREIEKQLGERSYQITGKTSDKNRMRIVQLFNDPRDSVRVCLLNTVAGGEAITLDKCSDDLVLLDPTWTESQEFQVVSRIHRVSRIHKVMVHRLFSEGSIDQWMAENTEEQRAVILSASPRETAKAVAGSR